MSLSLVFRPVKTFIPRPLPLKKKQVKYEKGDSDGIIDEGVKVQRVLPGCRRISNLDKVVSIRHLSVCPPLRAYSYS